MDHTCRYPKLALALHGCARTRRQEDPEKDGFT